MISVTSVTDNYILQPVLIEKHRATLDWLSAAALWKQEISFFQNVLDQRASKCTGVDDKKAVDHFQSLITYYGGEVIDGLRKKLRNHENLLADTLQNKNEANTTYFKEHDGLMDELESFQISFASLKEEFFKFTEKLL